MAVNKMGRCTHMFDVNLSILKDRFYTLQNICGNCNKKIDNWACIHGSCIYVACGRHQNGCMLKHKHRFLDHQVVLSLDTRQLWCYGCDDEILDFECYDDAHRPAGPDPKSIRALIDMIPVNRPQSGISSSSCRNTLGLSGLPNLGNTCYLNAALQCLVHCAPFQRSLRKCLRVYPFRCSVPKEDALLSSSAASSNKQTQEHTREMTGRLCDLFAKSWGGSPINSDILNNILRHVVGINPIFRGYGQQDSQELLRCVLSSIHEEFAWGIVQLHWVRTYMHAASHLEYSEDKIFKLIREVPKNIYFSDSEIHTHTHANDVQDNKENKEPSKTTSRHTQTDTHTHTQQRSIDYVSTCVSKCFMSSIVSTIRCSKCTRLSDKVDPIFDISTEIPQRRMDTHSPSNVGPSPGIFSRVLKPVKERFFGGDVEVSDCLTHFFEKERLTGNDKYDCEGCKSRVDADKVLSLLTLPPVLTLHFKRFGFVGGFFSQKNSKFVKFSCVEPLVIPSKWMYSHTHTHTHTCLP
eukprot:GHVR01164845.1.p1 GENE.GHVR01164845.1~~GHVR01164845.1.p1  ORF type:complete len:521 (+),score=114.35 GHVR01164845.1:32-1594(+)